MAARSCEARTRQPGSPRHLPSASNVSNKPMRIVPAQHEGNCHIVAALESQVAPSVGVSSTYIVTISPTR
jgi:hypothetical protein